MALTKIEWTGTPMPDGSVLPGFSFNPWVGCTKISPACDHCYAESWAKRTGHAELWQGQRRRTTAANWQQPVKWNRAAEVEGVRRKVFCCSLADVFDNQVPSRWRDDLWHLIDRTPHLDWLLLTKRPQNILRMLPGPAIGAPAWGEGWSNVWLGTTVENQDTADCRIPYLTDVPAILHFLSCEPLLQLTWPDLRHVEWVICGGESGPGARDMHPSWAASLMRRCAEDDVAFFMKQMARKAAIPADLLVREFPRGLEY